MPVLVSGYALYVPRERYSWGLSVDEGLFAAKKGNKLRATVLTFVGRAYVANKNEATLPYALLGVGFSETHADLAGGVSERGSGPAVAVGAGMHRVTDSAFNWAAEARFLRAAAPLRGLGISGPSLLAVTFSLTWRADPSGDPFGP